MHIDRLEFIDNIREIERKVAKTTRRSVTDISHWDPGKVYQGKMLSVLKLAHHADPIKYIYGYKIDNECNQQVLTKLGLDSHNFRCILMQSCTLAIVNIANFLKHSGIKKLCVLQPSYFSVDLCFNSFQIETISANLTLENGTFSLPVQDILTSGCEAVWITSPVFSVGSYYNALSGDIQALIERKLLVICDEALCISGCEISRNIEPSPYFISFYSPHKTIAVNAVKFAVIVCDKTHINFFEQWSDIFHGGLSTANITAIEHYITDNYEECYAFHKSFTDMNRNTIRSLIESETGAVMLECTHGQYATIFMPSIKFDETTLLQFIEDLIQNTHTSLLPGHLMGFDKEYGFCFRINLCMNPDELATAVCDVIRYLTQRM